MKPSHFFQTSLLAVSLMIGCEMHAETVAIRVNSQPSPRVALGMEKLADALKGIGDTVATGGSGESSPNRTISLSENAAAGKEGFAMASSTPGAIEITGGDDSGLLYGCLELADRIHLAGKLPDDLTFKDRPAMTLRGTCIGMQKTYILPGRKVYEYPYTPELFPWFYDQAQWREYLDFLLANRMNTLYLWSGHPFASLVKLKDYPYAVEVPPDVFQQNTEMYRWLAQECDRRGIWLVQMFYNILVSKPFAGTNGIATQLSAPTPLTADYTRKSIAEFVRQYPNVGLMACLGEALQGTANQLYWCTNVILPGMWDGMKAAGLPAEPPLVLRTHAMDAAAIIPTVSALYTNLYTVTKYNGESLTTWEPRGKDQVTHLAMSKLAPHLVNIHLLSNLEPFRYGDQQFIKKCVQASRDRLGATGIHLYPLSYWNWPNSPDLTATPLKQWNRDWIWYTAWARYEWNPDVPDAEDREYWIGRLAAMYGNKNAAKNILAAYNFSGEVAPQLIRRFGITEGNRQTLSLGMTLDQLVNPDKYGAIEDLWLSQAPPGERLDEYVKKEWNHQPHTGETPESVIQNVLDSSRRAVLAADAAAPQVTKNREEFLRLANDVRCIQKMGEFYAAKVRAAESVLRYNYSGDVADMQQAETNLEVSVQAYAGLVALTQNTYRFANGMQTSQRKIPVPGGSHGKGTNYLWSQLLPLYQGELAKFQARVAKLAAIPMTAKSAEAIKVPAWAPVAFTLISTNAETYPVMVGAQVFTDRAFTITRLAGELRGLTGIRFSHQAAKKGHYQPVELELSQPARVLVGFFKDDTKGWLPPPQLETDARADERGGVETILENAATVDQCPPVDVHAFSYDAGRQKLEFAGKGSFLILGVVPQTADLKDRDARGGEGP
jgi:hypothetical protein